MRNKQDLSEFENHFSDFDFSSLSLLHNGHEKCAAGKQKGPYVRDHYVFHLIVSGRGCLMVDHRTYPLRAGQGFFIAPGQLFQYQASQNDPWEYLWFGFKGDSVRKLLYNSWLMHTQPVYTSDRWHDLEGYMRESFTAVRIGGVAAAAKCHGLLYLSLAHLLEETTLFSATENVAQLTSVHMQYIYDAIDFIRTHIGQHFTTNDVAGHIGLNRSYFSRLFAQICGCPPSLFIGNYRLDLAWHMVRYSDMPIHQIAQAVGFDDAAYFARCFAERYGQAPSQLRRAGNRQK